MTFVKINETLYPAEIKGRIVNSDWNGRKTLSVTMTASYEQAAALFTDGMTWSHVYQADSYVDESGSIITPEPVEYDDSEYSVAGPITDNRDGTITATMGVITAEEALAELMEVINNG